MSNSLNNILLLALRWIVKNDDDVMIWQFVPNGDIFNLDDLEIQTFQNKMEQVCSDQLNC